MAIDIMYGLRSAKMLEKTKTYFRLSPQFTPQRKTEEPELGIEIASLAKVCATEFFTPQHLSNTLHAQLFVPATMSMIFTFKDNFILVSDTQAFASSAIISDAVMENILCNLLGCSFVAGAVLQTFTPCSMNKVMQALNMTLQDCEFLQEFNDMGITTHCRFLHFSENRDVGIHMTAIVGINTTGDDLVDNDELKAVGLRKVHLSQVRRRDPQALTGIPPTDYNTLVQYASML